jgi:histidine triad (HIT) family protein
LPGNIHYEDNEAVVFDNILDWAPIMLLVVPRRHITQDELWGSGSLMSKLADLAVQIGHRYAPNGFRVLSNFGDDALQTQSHGHLHVIGGAFLGRYVV